MHAGGANRNSPKILIGGKRAPKLLHETSRYHLKLHTKKWSIIPVQTLSSNASEHSFPPTNFITLVGTPRENSLFKTSTPAWHPIQARSFVL